MKLITELRNAMFSLCLFFVAGVFVLANADSAESESAVAELTILLHDFLANSNKAETHSRFWADDLVYTSSNGTRFGKDDIIAARGLHKVHFLGAKDRLALRVPQHRHQQQVFRC